MLSHPHGHRGHVKPRIVTVCHCVLQKRPVRHAVCRECCVRKIELEAGVRPRQDCNLRHLSPLSPDSPEGDLPGSTTYTRAASPTTACVRANFRSNFSFRGQSISKDWQQARPDTAGEEPGRKTTLLQTELPWWRRSRRSRSSSSRRTRSISSKGRSVEAEVEVVEVKVEVVDCRSN